jgi:hypothetical protein
MAKAITVSDLNTALKPILEALNRLREELTSHSSQVSEMHAMVTNISTKIDTLEQTAGATLSEISKPVVKKPTTRKPAAQKKPPTAKPPTKRGTKAEEEEEEEPEEEPEEPQTPVNKKAQVKTAKAPVKTAAAKKQAAPRFNKMTIFKEVFKLDPKKFDKYLTSKVKKEIFEANDTWKELSEEQLAGAKRNAYYHYMKDNHDDVLEEIKTAYIEKEAADEADT